MKRLFGIAFLLLVFFFPEALLAYSSVTVPVVDDVYRQLDKLAAHGLIKTMMRGQKPFVRYEIGRLIAEALKNYPEFEASYREDPNLNVEKSIKRLTSKIYVDRILEKLKKDYHAELVERGTLPGKVPTLDGRLLEHVQFDYLYLDEPKEAFPLNNGLGGIQALIQPLVENRGGRHYQSGNNLAIETRHWGRLGKFFSVLVEPRFQIQFANDPLQDEHKAFVQTLNGRFTLGKLDIEIGRDSITWGPSASGGLAFSTNPRPLDFVKISSVSPFYYPFFFKHLGENEMSLLIANLGPEQVFKNTWLVAYKISNRKFPSFELGFTHGVELGGEGAPGLSFGEVLVRSLGFNGPSLQMKSNHFMDIELLGTIPKWRGMNLYAELYFQDITTNFQTTLVDSTSYLAGLYLPRLNYAGTLDLRLEYKRLSPRYSRHPVFTDGMTENNLIIGDPLGPDSWGVLLEVNFDLNPKTLLSFSFQYGNRNNRIYMVQGNDVNLIADLGHEDRFLYRLKMQKYFRPNLVGRFALGLEQVQNENFSTGDSGFRWMGEAGVTFYLGPWKQARRGPPGQRDLPSDQK